MTAPVVVYRIEQDHDGAGPHDACVLDRRTRPHRPAPTYGYRDEDPVPDEDQWGAPQTPYRFGTASILQAWNWIGPDRWRFGLDGDVWVIAAYWVQPRHVLRGQQQLTFNRAYAARRKVVVRL